MNLENNLLLARQNCDEKKILGFVSCLGQLPEKGGPLTLLSSRHLSLARPTLPRVINVGQTLQRSGFFSLEAVREEELAGNEVRRALWG